MSDNKKKEADAAKALLNIGTDEYTGSQSMGAQSNGAPSESEFEFGYDPPNPQIPVSTIYNRRESGTYNQSKHKYGPGDTYETMELKDAARANAGMLTQDEIEQLFSEAQERQYQQQRKGGKSRRRKSRKSRKSRKNRRKTHRRRK
jgi:hypothetical protein